MISSRYRLAVLCLCVLAGCAARPYAPRELQHDAAAEYRDRRPELPALAQFASQSGYAREWPPEEWDFAALTLLALYFSPDIRVARAQADVSRAEIAVAGEPLPVGLTPALEHHSREVEGDGPWSLGVALNLPWVARSKREARVERAVALTDAAEFEVALSIWRVRAQARDRLIDLLDSRERLSMLESAASARREMRALVARRVEAGMLSARDLSQEDVVLAEIDSALAEERGLAREAQAAAARAVGLPLETFQRMTISRDPLPGRVEARSADALREAALRNRLDLYQRLRGFAAADAEVKLAVASQYPELTFSPGYFWDQGDSVWSLAAGMVFPPALRTKAAVRQAEARRELAAQRFLELQIQVIGEVERVAERLRSAELLAMAAAAQSEAARAQLSRVESLFERGGTDRLQLAAARIAAASAVRSDLQARTATWRALAGLEDAIQEPMFDSAQSLRVLVGAGAGK